MSKSISFRVTEAEHRVITAEAAVRGLTPSAYAKNALATHIQKYGRPEHKEAWEAPHVHEQQKTRSEPTSVGPQSGIPALPETEITSYGGKYE